MKAASRGVSAPQGWPNPNQWWITMVQANCSLFPRNKFAKRHYEAIARRCRTLGVYATQPSINGGAS